MTVAWLWLLPAALAVVDWYAVARGDRRTETWAKPLVMVALIAVATSMGASDAAGLWLLAALLLGLLGDIALLSDSLPRFRAGLAAFLVGHVAYVACFVATGLERPPWSWFGVLVLVGCLVATREVVPATHALGGPALSVPVAVYSAVIGGMLVCAWLTGSPLVALGATVFVFSDAVLSVNRFVRPLPHARLALMVTYHVGQALIVVGVLGGATG